MSLRRLISILLFVVIAAPAWAVPPVETLDDPELEQRARELSRELRCMVCQSESIHESDAPLAGDMRRLVRERIAAGDTDEEVKDYLVARYGDYVLLRPPMKPETYLLWYGPAAIAVLGVVGVGTYLWRRRRGAAAGAELSEEERRRLERILNDRDGSS